MEYILGIESTAHTFGAAIIDFNGRILSNVKDVYTTNKGGMIPLEVRKHHKNISNKIFNEALKEAKIKKEDLKAIAFSNAPGLAPCLLEGMNFVKNLALKLKIPIWSNDKLLKEKIVEELNKNQEHFRNLSIRVGSKSMKKADLLAFRINL